MLSEKEEFFTRKKLKTIYNALLFFFKISTGFKMKKIFLMLAIFFSVLTVSGAELFYNNGTSVLIEKSQEFVAVKIKASDAENQKGAVYSLNTGNNVYSFVSSTGKKGGDELPVYFLGDTPAVAERTVFWRGEKTVGEMEKKYGMKLSEIFPSYPLYAFSVEGDSVEISERIVKNGDGYAFPDFVREAPVPIGFVPGSEPEDPYFSKQWHLHNTGTSGLENADIKFKQMLEFLNSKRIEVDPNIKIAIMDSGVSRDHEDLKITEAGYDIFQDGEVSGGGTPNLHLLEGENVSDDIKSAVAHGTHCAGVSAEIGNQTGMSGVCPWCWIYPVRYPLTDTYSDEEYNGTGISENTILKIYEKYALDSSISVVNCSFGPGVSIGIDYVFPGIAVGIQNFMQNGRGGKGGVIVYASGNDNVDSSYSRLLEYDFVFEREGVGVVTNRVVTVNASTSLDMKASFSNYGYTSTVAAPGTSIGTTAVPGYGNYNKGDGTKDSNYTFFSGTSAAAPVVSGLFGVLFSINPELTLEDAMEILKQGADKINPETGLWDENGFSVKYGYGRVNLEKAVRLAAGFPMCAETKEEECGNHLDDDCDGYVDEGCAEELTAGQPCETDAECLTDSLSAADVSCVNELLSWGFEGGYCFRRSYQCPDGTQKLGNITENSRFFCALECNRTNPCTRPGYYCSDEVLGVCLPLCSDNTDCANGAVCNENGHCVTECGNGIINREDCDGYDNCIVTEGANEECDYGEDNGKTDCEYDNGPCKVCTKTCQLVDGKESSCGDYKIDVRNGEECDRGENPYKYCAYGETNCEVCTTTCRITDGILIGYCSDGVKNSYYGEACDDGNNEDGDYCSADCKTVTGRCGDGTTQSNEQCDNASDNGRTNCAYGETSCTVCTEFCKEADGITSYCGDSRIDESNGESCDDGADNGMITACAYGETSCTVCTTECKTAAGITSYCGDGIIDTDNGEICDDGAENGTNGRCTAECKEESEIPDEGDTAPDEGDTTPDEGDTAPDESDTAPDEGDTAPDEGDTAPDEGDTTPDESDTAPDEGDTVPDEGDTTPYESDTAPDEGDTVPDNGETSDDKESVDNGSVSSDDDAVETDDSSASDENKKKSGGCSLLVL